MSLNRDDEEESVSAIASGSRCRFLIDSFTCCQVVGSPCVVPDNAFLFIERCWYASRVPYAMKSAEIVAIFAAACSQ